jgi:hypothetical protein
MPRPGLESISSVAMNNGSPDHVSKAQDMTREHILQMGTNKMIPRYEFHKPFTVRLPDRREWERGFAPMGKGGLPSGIQMGPRQMKVLEPGCMAVA